MSVDANNWNTDFKIDGKWVLRSQLSGRFIQTRLGRLHNNVTQRVRLGGTKHRREYEGVTLHPAFKDPQKFCDWVVKQKGWGLGYALDKDLLGGREYGPDTAVFLPVEINGAIKTSSKGKYRTGTWPDGKMSWRASFGKVGLGHYPTEDEAHAVYCEFRELLVKLLADKYRDTIDPRAYAALLKWEVPGKARFENKFSEVGGIAPEQSCLWQKYGNASRIEGVA